MLNLKQLNSRQNKLFIKYCLIGVLSIFIELSIRKIFINLSINPFITLAIPLSIGILFAFFCNAKLNFNIPRYYYNKSFFYFSLISLTSFSIQYLLSKIIVFQEMNYELTRFVMSGLIFLIAYNFHIKFSFRRNKKVGVAIYLDSTENIDDIFSKVGFHPDFIHIDMVDRTMNPEVNNPDLNKFEEIKKIWPNHKIETHIMSKKPSKYLEKFINHSDVIYFHKEIDESVEEVKNLILKKGKRPGIVLHASKKYSNFSTTVDAFKEILVLCIDKPGKSGQKFLDEALTMITKINLLNNRSQLSLCVDGGLSLNNVKNIDCDKIVSASNVFKNINPKRQIINLQKTLNK